MNRDDEDEYDDRPRRPRRRDDDEDDDRPRPRRRDDGYDDRRRPPAEGGGGLATFGVVLGALSLCLGPLLGVPALICSVVARGRPGATGLATTGIVLGAVGTLLTPVVLIALLLPAVQKVRDAATRMKEQNNLKIISLGTLNHQSAYSQYPPADGPVSWRVHILPYLEQDPLYRRFDVRQPWDSPQNRPAANTQVKEYWSPLDPDGSTDTRYRVFTGPGTLYEPGRPPLPFNRVTDGTSNTLYVVDAAEAVPWASPRELPFAPNGPPPALGHPNRDLVQFSMLDGSVRSVRKSKLSPEVLRALVTPNGGEAFRLDD